MQSSSFQELYNAFRAAVAVTEEDLDSFAVSPQGYGVQQLSRVPEILQIAPAVLLQLIGRRRACQTAISQPHAFLMQPCVLWSASCLVTCISVTVAILAAACAAMQVQYRGSAEERADLLRHYNEFKGDMDRVFDWLMLSRPDLDSHRFRDTLEQAIAAGGVTLGPALHAWHTKPPEYRPWPLLVSCRQLAVFVMI